jgi:pimeloyl-ACP methyl ester carboxylesterase
VKRISVLIVILFVLPVNIIAGVKYEPTAKKCPKPDSKNRYIPVPLIHNLKEIAKIGNIPNLKLHDDLRKDSVGLEINVYYEFINDFDPSKELLILIPGGPGESHTFIHDFVNIFNGKSTIFEKFNVISMDHRGLGCSRPIFPGGEPAESLEMRFAAADIELIREELTPDKKINVWGYSYGSMLAQTYALLFPESIEKLFLGGAFSAASDFTKGKRAYEDLVVNSSVGHKLYNRFVSTYPEFRIRFLDYTVEEMYSYEGRVYRIPQKLAELLSYLDRGEVESANLLFTEAETLILPWMMRSISCLEIVDSKNELGVYPMFNSTFGTCTEFSLIADLFDYTESLVNLHMDTFIWGGKYDHVTPANAMLKMANKIPNSYIYIDQHIGHDYSTKIDCLGAFIDGFFEGVSQVELDIISKSTVCVNKPTISLKY